MKKLMKDIFLKLMFNVEYLEKLHENYIIKVYHFYMKKMQIEKVEKLAANSHDKTEYVTHIRNSNHALNPGLLIKMLG